MRDTHGKPGLVPAAAWTWSFLPPLHSNRLEVYIHDPEHAQTQKWNKETNWVKEGGRKNWNPIPPPAWSHQVSEETNRQTKATHKPWGSTCIEHIHRKNAAKGPNQALLKVIPVRLLKVHFTNLWKTSSFSKILIYNKQNKSCSSLCVSKGSQPYKPEYCVYGQLIFIQLPSSN